MQNILIFKTDRIGDLINISPIINNIKLNYPDSNIYLICSEYNYSVAKFYNKLITPIIFKKPFIKFLLSNYNILLKKKFDIILQLDGKNHSYFSSVFISSRSKNAIKYVKEKKIFGFKYLSNRPIFPIYKLFNHLEISDENYNLDNNISYHYLSLYLNLLKKNSFKLFSKKHYFPIIEYYISYKYNNYILFHIDEKWNQFDEVILFKLVSKIKNLSKDFKILVTTNLNGNLFFYDLIKFIKNINNIHIINDSSVDDLIQIIYNSNTVVSCHSGIVVHLAACFDKKIIDTVPKNIFNELDRWIPIDCDYKRYDINDLDNVRI